MELHACSYLFSLIFWEGCQLNISIYRLLRFHLHGWCPVCTWDSAQFTFNKFFWWFWCLLSSLSKTNQLHFNCEIFSAQNSPGLLRKEIEPLILNEKWLYVLVQVYIMFCWLLPRRRNNFEVKTPRLELTRGEWFWQELFFSLKVREKRNMWISLGW